MQVGTGKSVLNGIAIGKLKIYKKKDTAISTAPVADTAAELERFEAARQKAIEQQTALYEKALAEAARKVEAMGGSVTIPGEGNAEAHSSGSLSTMIGCNCLVELPAGSGPVTPGEEVEVLSFVQ